MTLYKLDPAWYLLLLDIVDAMLKMTDIELELLNDYHKILMIKNGISEALAPSRLDTGNRTTSTWVKRSIRINHQHS